MHLFPAELVGAAIPELSANAAAASLLGGIPGAWRFILLGI